MDDKEMSFLDHLEELRWHLIRSLISVMVFTVLAFFSKRLIFHHIILGPSRPDFWTYRKLCELGKWLQVPELCIEQLNFTIQSRTITGQFSTHITTSIVAGLVLAFPYTFWEIWRFVKPGLYPRERQITRGAVFFVSVLFFAGILFGYYILSPMSINFLANYQVDESIQNEFDLLSYISTLLMMVLASGIMFQLPMVVYVLSKAGLVTPSLMRTYRRHAIIVILIVAAVLTPSPDIFSQLLIATPIYLLYEISIFLSAREEAKRKKALQTQVSLKQV